MEYSELLKTSSNIFSNYYIIDIINDKVLEYDNNYNLISEETFYNFVENMKRIIHTEDINKYFDLISLSKLTEEKNNGNDIINCNYKKIINNNYKDITSFVKLIEKDNNKYIILFETEALLDKNNNVVIDNSNEIEKIKYISDNVSDVIFKIFNTINSIDDDSERIQINHVFDYITNILNNLVKDIPEVNKGLESHMISEINKNKPTLLIVDDDLMTRNLIKKAFDGEYEIIMATDGQKAIDILEENKNKSNVEIRDNIVGMFLDLAMPVLDGFAVLDYLKINNILKKIPVIIISAAEEKSTRQRVYQYGIADMIEKPFNLELIKYRTDNLINLYKTSNSLDEIISKKNENKDNILKNILDSYLEDNSFKNNYISKISNYFFNKLVVDYPEYRLNNENIYKIVEASKYYDIGTYLLPRVMGKLDNDVYKHTNVGSEFIEYGLKNFIDKDIYNYAIEIAKFHHERYDGTGPHTLSGQNIPIYVQIIMLAIECSEMLINQKTINDLYSSIVNEKEKKYNPVVVSLFEKYYSNLFN